MKSPTRAFLSFSSIIFSQNGVERDHNKSYYEKLLQTLEVFTMKKFLLVTMIGLVLAMDLYGIVNQFMTEDVKEIDRIAETTTTVYME